MKKLLKITLCALLSVESMQAMHEPARAASVDPRVEAQHTNIVNRQSAIMANKSVEAKVTLNENAEKKLANDRKSGTVTDATLEARYKNQLADPKLSKENFEKTSKALELLTDKPLAEALRTTTNRGEGFNLDAAPAQAATPSAGIQVASGEGLSLTSSSIVEPKSQTLSNIDMMLPKATVVKGAPVDLSQGFYADPLKSVTAVAVEPIQAIQVNDLFNPEQLQEVHAVRNSDVQENQLSTEQAKTSNLFERTVDYNARRTGQADSIKANDALVAVDSATSQINQSEMSEADKSKLANYKRKLSSIMKQYDADPTQIKSSDLAEFLNSFNDFSKKEMNYSEKSLERSSWQKVIDAIQDFFDIILKTDVQPLVVAVPVGPELIQSPAKLLIAQPSN